MLVLTSREDAEYLPYNHLNNHDFHRVIPSHTLVPGNNDVIFKIYFLNEVNKFKNICFYPYNNVIQP